MRAALRLLGKDEDDWPLAAAAFEDAGVDVSALLYGPRRLQGGKAWQHVPKAFKADLRRAYVQVLDARIFAAAATARPVPPHPPPPLREAGFAVEGPEGFRRVVRQGEPEYGPPGCLACGVGLSAQWHGPVTMTAYTRGPGVVEGFLCDACVPHLEAAGAHGQPFLERAVMAHFGKEWSEAVRMPRLRAWVAIHRGDGLPPQDEPWAWVTELVEPEPEIDPLLALQIAVADLTAKVAELEARLET